MFSLESSVKSPYQSRLILLVLVTLFPLYFSNSQDAVSQDSLDVTLSQARAYSIQKDYSNAVVLYKQYLFLRPSDDDVRNELARSYSWDSEYDSAVAQYNIVIQKNRNNFDAHFGKCQVLAWQHYFRDALQEVETLIILSPKNVDVFLLAGRIQGWNKDFIRSLEMYQKALALDGLNEEAIVGNSKALEGLGKSDEAYSEIAAARTSLPHSIVIEQRYTELAPRTLNQLFANYQQENFNTTGRSDHRTFTAQYYRGTRTDLTLYAEFDEYRRFDQDNQSLGIGAYWTIAERQSLFAYCLVSPNPRVTSTVDFSVELTQRLSNPVSAFLAYRLLDFETETAHIVSPGLSLEFIRGVIIKPRVYVSRTVVSKATSIAYALQMSSESLGNIQPFLYYAVGNEAYRGVTLDNVESSDSWSVTIGGRYVVSRELTLTVGYQYLNRIGFFHSNLFSLGGGYFW